MLIETQKAADAFIPKDQLLEENVSYISHLFSTLDQELFYNKEFPQDLEMELGQKIKKFKQ